MGIRRHNRTIWILALVTFFLLLLIFLREGKLRNSTPSNGSESSGGEATSLDESTFGDRVSEIQSDSRSASAQNEEKFAETLNRLFQCFQSNDRKNENPANKTTVAIPVQAEALFQQIQLISGPVTQQSDHWMNWTMKTKEGQNRRLQIQITEDDTGKVGRELHFFNVSPDGRLSPLQVPAEAASNPTDEVIKTMLKEGDVIFKERAAVAFFENGDRVEYVEKDNELSEIEVFHGEKQFRCHSVRLPESCQCQ